MKKYSVDPIGYLLAPLVAPIGYLITVPVWFLFQFGFDGMQLLRWFWQFVFFLLLISVSLTISPPVLWLLRGFAQYILLPKHLFWVLVIALTLLFSWLVLANMSATSSILLASSVVFGLTLNFLVFGQLFCYPLTHRSSGTPCGAP